MKKIVMFFAAALVALALGIGTAHAVTLQVYDQKDGSVTTREFADPMTQKKTLATNETTVSCSDSVESSQAGYLTETFVRGTCYNSAGDSWGTIQSFGAGQTIWVIMQQGNFPVASPNDGSFMGACSFLVQKYWMIFTPTDVLASPSGVFALAGCGFKG